MRPTLRFLIDFGDIGEQCRCLKKGKFCTTKIEKEDFKTAQSLLRSRRFVSLRLDYEYDDDLRELARCSFCMKCEEEYDDQCEDYYRALLKGMGEELKDLKVPEVTISTPKPHVPSGKAGADGCIFTPADQTKDNQGVKWTERVENLEAEKEELNKQILDLTQQLEQQRKIAETYLKERIDLCNRLEQLKHDYAMGKAERMARENALLTRIVELERQNSQSQQDTHVPRMANVKELLQVSGAVKVLHDKLSWFLGSRPEDEEEEEL